MTSMTCQRENILRVRKHLGFSGGRKRAPRRPPCPRITRLRWIPASAMKPRKRRRLGLLGTSLPSASVPKDHPSGRCLNAELAQIRTQLKELVAIVQLYKALGGGWTP